jgi:hypothetical protein
MVDIERRQEEAGAHIRAAIMSEFCRVMSYSGLPPMAVLRLAVQAIGSVYRDMAEVHSGPDACPCNWRPNEQADVDVLCAALMAAIRFKPIQDLRAMQPAGSA